VQHLKPYIKSFYTDSHSHCTGAVAVIIVVIVFVDVSVGVVVVCARTGTAHLQSERPARSF
jgi:hypothetical protein